MFRFCTFASWFPLNKDYLKADLIAGVTVALLLIPQSMAYAELAGLDAHYGLYAAFVPVLLGAMFGSLRQLGTGPVAMTSILTASVLVKYIPDGNPENYAKVAFLLALIVGLIRIFIGCFRLAFVVNFLANPVVQGFTNAGALIIGLSQINKIFALPMEVETGFAAYMIALTSMFMQLENLHIMTTLIGIVSIVVIMLVKKYKPRFPAMLVAVILASVFSYVLEFEAKGGSVVGEIPSGLPSIAVPWQFEVGSMDIFTLSLKLIPDAILITMIGFMEVLAVSKAVSLKTNQKLDFNHEMIGQGISAVGGSFFQSYPTSGSFSRTAMNLMCGAKTAMSSVFTSIIVVIVLLFFTGWLYYLPKATLAAGIIVSILSLINFKIIYQTWKVSRLDGGIAIFTFVATMLCAPDIINGVIIGGSIALVLYVVKKVKGSPLKVKDLKLVMKDKTLSIELKGGLYFPQSPVLERLIQTKVKENNYAIERVVIDASQLNELDSSAIFSFSTIRTFLASSNIVLEVKTEDRRIIEMIQRGGLGAVLA